MPRGLTIPNSMWETVVRMSADLSPEDTRTYTDISEQQQSQITSLLFIKARLLKSASRKVYNIPLPGKVYVIT